MAELVSVGGSVLSGIIDLVLQKVATSAQQLLLGSTSKLRRSLQKLQITLSIAKGMVVDAEERANCNKDQGLRAWVASLRDAMYDADDVLDELDYEQLKKKANKPSRYAYLRKRCLVKGFEHAVTAKINEIQERFDYLLTMANYYQLKMSSNQPVPKRKTTSFLDNIEIEILGRDHIRDHIVELLKNDDLINSGGSDIRSCDGKIPILTIIGMGGIGKTTLAQMVCNNNGIKDYFQSNIIWVCVSDDFDDDRIIKEILESVKKNSSTCQAHDLGATLYTNLDIMRKNLDDALKRRRFLLVLDDVWNENVDKWHRLANHFRVFHENRGSKILVTCRKEKVAETMSSNVTLTLNGLLDGDFRHLFEKIVFSGLSTFKERSQHKEIGEKIAKKLMGSPLAAKTIGRILRSNFDIRHWENILQSEIWELQQDDNDIMPALRISYQHLPEHLKPCFAFCSLFPRDFVYDKGKIVEMWIALGFVQQQSRGVLMEDIGKDYVNELLNSSMFQPCNDRDTDDMENVFVIHDLIHDLAKMVSIDEALMVKGENDIDKLSSTIRYLSISINDISDMVWNKLIYYENFTSIRSLIFLHDNESSHSRPEVQDRLSIFIRKQISKMKLLRVLHLSGHYIKEFPISFRKVKHLRYLNLSDTNITKFSNSIGCLHQLQVLAVNDSSVKLPLGLRKLIKLRHIHGKMFCKDIYTIMNLISIQELRIRVTKKYGLEALANKKEMRQLRIFDIQNVRCEEAALKMQLKNMKHLTTLWLFWGDSAMTNYEEKVLEALEPNPNILHLFMHCNLSSKYPNWMENSSLPKLQTLYMKGFPLSELSPPLNKFQSLKTLHIVYTKKASNISPGETITSGPALNECSNPLKPSSLLRGDGWLPPKLEVLEIDGCDFLMSMHLYRLVFLKKLTISNCRSIELIPHEVLKTLKYLRITNCEKLVIEEHKTLTCLQTLHIEKCSQVNLESIKGLLSSSLKDLGLMDFTNFQHISHCLINLTDLVISNVAPPALQSPSKDLQDRQMLQRLKYLTLNNASPEKIKDWLVFFRGNTSLVYISFETSETLTRFDDETEDALCKIASLHQLFFYCLPNLQKLPERLHDISSLWALSLTNCPKVQVLPELPRDLQFLRIWECPLLKKRYKQRLILPKPKEISHVPVVKIDMGD